jgi:aryl-alcohol dehydrogenase-like predicted oxidoreductase
LLGNVQTVGLTEIVGRWLVGKRNNFIVATKCFAAMGPNPWDRGTSQRHILEAVDNSCGGSDRLDRPLPLHNYAPVPMDEALEAMDCLAGRARSTTSAFPIGPRSDWRGRSVQRTRLGALRLRPALQSGVPPMGT